MRALTDHEKRTVRIASILIGAYLVLFVGWKGWAGLSAKRLEYQTMLEKAQARQKELQLYSDKADKIKDLMEKFKMDPAKLSRASVVAGASDAIQKAGRSGGLQFGPIRETHSRTSAKELGSIQLEGDGQLPAVLNLLHNMQSLGYPLIIDSVQITPNPMRPGMVKLSMTVIVMDFEAWKAKEAPNA